MVRFKWVVGLEGRETAGNSITCNIFREEFKKTDAFCSN